MEGLKGAVIVIGQFPVLSSHAPIYTVQIDDVVCAVPGEGWLCTTREGNYVIARTPSTLEAYCRFVYTCTQLKAILQHIHAHVPGQSIRLPRAFIKHDCSEEHDGL